MRRAIAAVPGVLGGLVALVIATATSVVAEHFGVLVMVAAPVPTPYRLDGLTVVVAGSLVAGTIYAVLLLSARRTRALPVALALLSLALLAAGEYVQRTLGIPELDLTSPGAHDPVGSGDLLLQRAWERDTVPTVAGAALAVAIIVRAVLRGSSLAPAVLSGPGRSSTLGVALACAAGAGAWVTVGFGTVARTLLHGDEPVDWSGGSVPWPYLAFGSDAVLYLTLAATVVAGGALYAVVLSDRLPPWVPLLVGGAFIGVATVCFAGAIARIGDAAPRGRGLEPSDLLLAVQLAWQVPAYTSGVLLAVPLIVVGLHRRAATRGTPAWLADPTAGQGRAARYSGYSGYSA